MISGQWSVIRSGRTAWRAAGLRRIFVRGSVFSVWLVTLCAASAGTNELVNGGFDDPKEPLKGWVHNYEWTGNKFYRDNHTRLSVVEKDGT